MQTQVSLSDLGRLVDGHLENPSSILGPHPVDYRGAPATAVRSFLPEAKAAWIIDRASGARRPMRKLHPAGFFEAICEQPLDGATQGHHDAPTAATNSDQTQSTYRIQMEAYLEKGNRPMAIKTYQTCEKILEEEFGIEPLPETQLLLRKIKGVGV